MAAINFLSGCQGRQATLSLAKDGSLWEPGGVSNTRHRTGPKSGSQVTLDLRKSFGYDYYDLVGFDVI